MNNIYNKKQSVIQFRVTKEDKKRIAHNAKSLGMNISQYMQYIEAHKNITILDGGKELADELYNFNRRLDKLTKCSTIEIQQIRDKISETLQKINQKIGD